jgi:hypothetical protein
MNLEASFNNDSKVYGLLFPMGLPERHCWEMAFYLSERTRKRGITYLHNLLGEQCPILKFELTLSEIRERAILAPFIPKDRSGKLDHVVNPQWKHKGAKRPIYKDN